MNMDFFEDEFLEFYNFNKQNTSVEQSKKMTEISPVKEAPQKWSTILEEQDMKKSPREDQTESDWDMIDLEDAESKDLQSRET
jgi:hypothetical protein